MSLINDVLKDLDSKPEHEDKSILGLMHSTPEKTSSSSAKWPILLLLTLIISAAGGYVVFISLYKDTKASPFIAQPLDNKPSMDVVTSSVASETTAASKASVADAGSLEVSQQSQIKPIDQSETKSVKAPEEALIATKSPVRQEVIEQPKEPAVINPQPKYQSPSPAQAKSAANELESKKALSEEQNLSTAREVASVNNQPVKPKQAGTSSTGKSQIKPAPKSPVIQKVNATAEPPKEKATTPVLSKSKTREVQLYEQALSAYQRGSYEESERLIDGLLATHAKLPSNVSTNKPKHQALKARLLLNKKPDLLVNYIDKNNVDIASSDELLALSATAYQRTKDHVRAVQAYDLLVQRQPTEGRWWLAMAFSLESLDALDKALKAYSLALQSGTLPANAREYAATKANQITKKIEALAKQAEEQK